MTRTQIRFLEAVKRYSKARPLCGRTFMGNTRNLRRSVINPLRRMAYPICSDERGYWYGRRKADVRKTIEQLEGRKRGMTAAINGLKKRLGET